ncbi:Casein kinase II, beta subunit [Olea europaea subsp. europaea]|uniref:Casein kinase II, beta subunit n=1 Tax=Olea europaea subsp. europaea TaxID=158383 RepID=A0A8S0U967_OLEEU|nr:Casein kinase II, beta subunit [Olea europaea subsp. europaea]
MYRDRGRGGGSLKGGEMLDRKRINDALDKHLEKSSPSTSRNKPSSSSIPSTSASAGKHVEHRDARAPSNLNTSKNMCSDGRIKKIERRSKKEGRTEENGGRNRRRSRNSWGVGKGEEGEAIGNKPLKYSSIHQN